MYVIEYFYIKLCTRGFSISSVYYIFQSKLEQDDGDKILIG